MRKALAVLIIILAAMGVYFYAQSRQDTTQNTPPEDTTEQTPITITFEEIREENYTGSRPAIAGESKLADAARAYVENLVTGFAAQADADVPAMRQDWGEDSPAASYNIEIGAKLVEGEQTKSIIITEYVYTGGAHGSSSYKTFTASFRGGKLLSLSDIIKPEKEIEFLTLVKEKLNGWRPEGSDTPVLFTEDVVALSFASFENWAFDKENFILYFSQYEVGPGVLGAFELPIPRAELGEILR